MERNIYKIGKELFITNDEELVLGGYHFNSKYGDEPQKTNQRDINSKKYWEEEDYYITKIILTTDQDLIKDGVQGISDYFLEWLVNNPTCEYVKVDLIPVNTFGSEITVNGYGFDKFIYKITIPQEESKYPIGGYAPGFYSCKCFTCKKEFTGDKRAVQCEPCAIKMIQEEPKKEWNPTQGEEVWIKVFSNWSLGTYIGYDIDKEIHLVREPKEGGGHLFSSKFVLPYSDMPNEPKKETLEEAMEKNGYHDKPSDDLWREGVEFGAKWQAEKMYSEEDMFEFSQWISHEDWVYLPSKGYWVNEEQEELEQKLSSKEILNLWFEKFKKK